MDQAHEVPEVVRPAPSPPARTRGRRRLLPWILLALIVAAVTTALLRPHPKSTPSGRSAASDKDMAQPVARAVARLGDMPVTLTELGTVTPLATVTVQSQIAGYLQEVDFLEGQEVHRGDQLALIDPRPYQATLDQYQGQLARDTAALNQARIDLARYQGLLRQHSIAKQQVDDQVYAVAQYEGSVRSDQAQIDNAALNVAYCHIRAPVDGRVGLRQVDAGNYVTQGLANGLVVLTMLHPISVIFSVPEDNLLAITTRLRTGAVLPVEAYDRTNTTHLATGHVAVLDNQVDTSTGTVKLRAVFDNADETLFPNQFVNARLLVDTEHGVVLVPGSAVQTGPDGPFLYVIKPAKPAQAEPAQAKPEQDNQVEVRRVTVGVASATDIVVASGLQAGEQVVTDGTDHLRDGSKVMIPTAASTSGAAGQDQHPHRTRKAAAE